NETHCELAVLNGRIDEELQRSRCLADELVEAPRQAVCAIRLVSVSAGGEFQCKCLLVTRLHMNVVEARDEPVDSLQEEGLHLRDLVLSCRELRAQAMCARGQKRDPRSRMYRGFRLLRLWLGTVANHARCDKSTVQGNTPQRA